MSSNRPLSNIESQALAGRTLSETVAILKEWLGEDPRAGARRLISKYEKLAESQMREKARLEKLWDYERGAFVQGARRIAGVDEAGRGPLVGAVVAAAVILPEGWATLELNDSKKLTPEKREKIFSEIQKNALGIGVGQASPGEIDEHNIYRATQLAMGRAVGVLAPLPDFLLTDAMPLPRFSSIPQKPLVHGDALSASIAAASIIAKVTRDRMMEELHQRYPEYGFASHKGYGTEEHLRAIQKHGVCPEHRLSFSPVTQTVIRNTAQGPMVFWKQRLESAKNSQELEQIGFQLKRLGAAGLKESELGSLREVYRQKKTDWDQGNK